jgi:hypothetical protein
VCKVALNVACPWHHCQRCRNAPPSVPLYSHPISGLRKRSASVNVRQRVQFSRVEQFSDTPLLRTHFHVRRHFAGLLHCRTATGITNYWREGSTSIAIPPVLASNVVGQHNKTRAITLCLSLVHMQDSSYFLTDVHKWKATKHYSMTMISSSPRWTKRWECVPLHLFLPHRSPAMIYCDVQQDAAM